MKHYAYLLFIALALVGCEKNAQEADNTQYKDFSVATYIYYYDDWSFESWTIDSIPSTFGEIAFADDYRCATYTRLDKHNERPKTQSDYFYYELDYPYIKLYNVSGFFRWDFTQDTAFIRASTKEE